MKSKHHDRAIVSLESEDGIPAMEIIENALNKSVFPNRRITATDNTDKMVEKQNTFPKQRVWSVLNGVAGSKELERDEGLMSPHVAGDYRAAIEEVREALVLYDGNDHDYEQNHTHTTHPGCPCLFTEPCSYACSCANPLMSGGCSRCATYGNEEQRKIAAQRIANILDSVRSCYAPWTDKQVKNLELRQAADHLHPYTCECGELLIPTKQGWICDRCTYTQTWCHPQDANEHPPPLPENLKQTPKEDK